MLKDTMDVLKRNQGIVLGAVAGHFTAGIAIGAIEKAATPVLGSMATKIAKPAAGLVVTGLAAFAGSRLDGKTHFGVAFAGVALGHTINAAIQAFQG